MIDIIVIAVSLLVISILLSLKLEGSSGDNTDLESLTDSVTDTILTIGADNKILFCNQASEKVFGWKSQELVGQDLTVLIPERLREPHKLGFKRYLSSGKKTIDWKSVESVGLHKDGTEFPIELSFGEYKKGRERRFSGVLRDITQRREYESKANQLSAIVKFSDDAIISKDLNGVIQSWNTGAENIFGYTEKEILGKNIRILFSPEKLQEEDEIIAKIKRGEVIEHYPTARIRKDGTSVPVSITASPIKDASGNVIGASKIARDISSAVQAAEEKERLLLDATELKRAAEWANQEKDRFLASLSHELRTPLVSVLGYATLLAKNKLKGEETMIAIETIQRNSQLQVGLIEDLLDVSRIVSGKISINKSVFSIKEVVETSVNTIAPQVKEKNLSLTVNVEDVAIHADKKRISQILLNLLVNAVKFTQKGSIEIIGIAKNGFLEVSVSDTGLGIKEENLGKIFEQFTQVDSSSTRTYGGLGLGLSIVRRLVDIHGGNIEVVSEFGKGTVFTFSIPTAVETVSGTLEGSEEVVLAGVSVLILEDNVDTAEYLKVFYTLHGAEIDTAHSVKRARELLSGKTYDLYLCDIAMPDEDGYSFITSVREKGDKTPAVALTAYSNPDITNKAFDRYLRKPASEEELLDIKSLLTNKSN